MNLGSSCRFSVLVVCLFTFVIQGCATPNIDRGYVLNSTAESGVVSGSITYQGGYSGYRVYYRSLKQDGESGFFQWGKSNVLIPYFPKGDFESLGIKGALFAAELSAGDYEIYQWSVGSGPAIVKPIEDFSIRFTVEPAKAVYLGNFNFVQTDSMGLTITGAEVSYADMSIRDLSVLQQKYPNFSKVPVKYAVPPSTNINRLGGNTKTKFYLMIPVVVN